MKTPALDNEMEVTARFMTGDEQAFRQLFDHYYQPVFNNIYRLIKNRFLTEDILQDTFLALWEKRDTLKNPENVSGWLFVTSAHKAINFIRREVRGIRGTRSLDGAPEPVATEPLATEDTDPFDYQTDILKKAMDTLSPQQIKAFELCKLKGHTYEEAAREMNITKNTVKMHLQRANTSIRAFVDRQPLVSLLLLTLSISSH